MKNNAPNHADSAKQKPQQALQEELFETIDQEINLSKTYLLLLVFSTIIATLGLLINSAAVVIGAMLISPLFWPIIGLSLSIITSRNKLAKRASLNLSVSIGLVILIGAVLGGLSPIKEITPEIYARTNPTLLDLGIAVATSVIGVLAIYHHQISRSATGVAVSIALLPALCVSGVGITYGSWPIFLGAFLLFATNTAAIIFIGAITFYFLHIRPQRKAEEARLRMGLIASFIVLFLLSIPLTLFLHQAITQNRLSRQIKDILTQKLTTQHPEARLDDLDIRYPQIFSDGNILIRGNVYLPEGTSLTSGEQNALVNAILDKTDYGVDLNLNLVISLVLRRDEEVAKRQLRQNIQIAINAYLSELPQPIAVDELDIAFSQSSDDTIQILLMVRQHTETTLNYSHMLALEKYLEDQFSLEFSMSIELLPTTKLDQNSVVQRFEQEIHAVLQEQLQQYEPLAYLDEVLIDYPALISQIQPEQDLQATSSAILGIQSAAIKAFVYLPEGSQIESSAIREMELGLSEHTQANISLDLHLIYYFQTATNL